MLLQRSRLAAKPAERPRLAPPWSIAVLGAMVLLALVAIYPHQALIKRVFEAPAGEITNAYLVNLLRTDPDNPRLRLMLARSQILAGQYAQVAQTIAPAARSNDPALRLEALWLRWQSGERRYQQLPATAPERAQLKVELRLELAAIADENWSQETLSEIARKAMAFGEVTLGLRLFDRMAATSREKSGLSYAEAAQSALGNSEYRAAAEFYLIALGRSPGLAEQRRNFLAAMRALESGDRIAEALNLAEEALKKTPALADDQQILTLLVRFSRAARRPDLADKYARRLLRMAVIEALRREALAANGLDFVIRRVAATDAANKAAPVAAFDDKTYTLGYEVFLENRKLDDAWRVAASAVRQAPNSVLWRERLARVSEWTGKPKMALDNWLAIAQMSGRDDAWQNVLRLAPGLFDDEALRAALRHELVRQPDDRRLITELAAIYERLGDPRGGLRALAEIERRSKAPWLLEAMAELAERAGDEELALSYWQRYLANAELTPARGVRVATLMLLRGDADAALALLDRARAAAGDGVGDFAFWRLSAEIAELVQNDASAVGAYRHVVGSPAAEMADYAALHLLLEADYPLEAAQVAAAAWRRFAQPEHLLQALTGYASAQRWQQMRALFNEVNALDAAKREALRRQPGYLLLSAQYLTNTGQVVLARRELDAARRQHPDAPDVQLALLWLLIDGGDAPALRSALASGEGRWRDDAQMHEALGAAYLALSLPEVALRRYLTPHLSEHRDDFLWLMNYADALEQNQQPDRAWRLREQLLAGQRRGRESGIARTELTGDDVQSLTRVARARLVIAQRPGDPGLAALRELLRLDRDGQKSLSPAARDVALGWLQEAQQPPAARAWLWQEYAKTAVRPMWAEISLALAEHDRESAGRLLERYGERLPRHDRIEAARLADQLRAAQSDAFDTQSLQGEDDTLHALLSDALLAHSNHVGGELARRDSGSVVENERSARWHLAFSPALSVDLGAGRIERDRKKAEVIGSAPDEEFRSARFAWRHGDGETHFGVEARKSFETYHPLLLEHEQRVDDKLSWTAALGHELAAEESTALRIAGMKKHAALGVIYRPTQLGQISVGRSWDRYVTQAGDAIGNSQVWEFEAAHTIGLLPRDLEAALFASSHRFSHEPISEKLLTRINTLRPWVVEDPLSDSHPATADEIGDDFFLPDNFRFYGVRLSTDTRFEREYTRAWRPYASAAKTWHSKLKFGYELAAGIAGSVFGNDHLQFGWRLGKGGATSDDRVREIGFTYRLNY